ncbi:MAG: hypothetical protein R3E39_10770 [Anaerolineae bacterium]
MRRITIPLILILMLFVTWVVRAQTETPEPTPTMVPGSDSLMVPISDSLDDVNESSGKLTVDTPEVWFGNGGEVANQYLGLRFKGLSIPQGSEIISAKLEVYSAQEQWIDYSFTLAAEAADKSEAFSEKNPPSAREQTAEILDHESNVKWEAGTWQTFDDLAPVIQEVIDRPGWTAGNNIALIAEGTESGGEFGRKFVTSYDGDPAFAPRLTVNFLPSEEIPPTATPTVAPPPTAVPTDAPTPSQCSEVPERLVVGGTGRVLSLAGAPRTPLNIRQNPSLEAPRFARLAPGVVFDVVDGPVCVDGVAWFEVSFGERARRGWIAEGADGVYFVEPVE